MTINPADNKRDLIYITNDGKVKYDHAIIMKQAAEYIKNSREFCKMEITLSEALKSVWESAKQMAKKAQVVIADTKSFVRTQAGGTFKSDTHFTGINYKLNN